MENNSHYKKDWIQNLWEKNQKRYDVVTLVSDVETIRTLLSEKSRIPEMDMGNYIDTINSLIKQRKKIVCHEINIALNTNSKELEEIMTKIDADFRWILESLIAYKEKEEKDINRYLDKYQTENKDFLNSKLKKHSEIKKEYNEVIQIIYETLPENEKEKYKKHIDQE